MLLGVVLSSFFNVMLGLKMVPVRDLGVMSCLLVLACFVLLCRFFMMVCGVFAVFRRVLMVFGSGLCIGHVIPPVCVRRTILSNSKKLTARLSSS